MRLNKKQKIQKILDYYVVEYSKYFADDVKSDYINIKNNIDKLHIIYKIVAELSENLDKTMEHILLLDNFNSETIDNMLEQFSKADRSRLN